MSLRVNTMFRLVVLRIFGRNRKSAKRRKTGKSKAPTPQRRVPSQTATKGCFAAARPRAKNPPQVRQGVALLRRGEVLRRDEDTIHRGKKFRIFVSKFSYSCTDSLRTLIND